MDVPERKGFSFTFKAVGNKVDAFFEDESGKIKKIEKTKEDEENLAYGIISIQMKFQDKVKELDYNLWDRAVQYSADYGGVGRVKFYHLKDKKEKPKDE